MNKVRLAGTFKTNPVQMDKKQYYVCTVGISRLSGIEDTINIRMGKNTYDRLNEELKGSFIGEKFDLYGYLESERVSIEGSDKASLKVFVWVKYIYTEYSKIPIFGKDSEPVPEHTNIIELTATLVKKFDIRTTTYGRKVRDIFVIVPQDNKKYFIPCIAFESVQSKFDDIELHSTIHITGRLQSRNYVKNDVTNTVYELAIGTVELEQSKPQ